MKNSKTRNQLEERQLNYSFNMSINDRQNISAQKQGLPNNLKILINSKNGNIPQRRNVEMRAQRIKMEM